MRGKLKQAGWSDTGRAEILFGQPAWLCIKVYGCPQCVTRHKLEFPTLDKVETGSIDAYGVYFSV